MTLAALPSAQADGWRVRTLTADGVRFFVHGTGLSPNGQALVLLSRRERARGQRARLTYLELWRGRRARRLFSSRLCCVPVTAEVEQGRSGGPVAVWHHYDGRAGLLDHGRVRSLHVPGKVRRVDLDVADDGSAAIVVVGSTGVYVATRSRFGRFGPLRLVERDDAYYAGITTSARGSGLVAWQTTERAAARGFAHGGRRGAVLEQSWSRRINYDGGSGPLVRPLLGASGRGLLAWGDSDRGLLATPWPAAARTRPLVDLSVEEMGATVSRGRIWLSWVDYEDDEALVVRRWGPRGGLRDTKLFRGDVVLPLLIPDRRGGVYVLSAFNDSSMVRIHATGRAERAVPLPAKAALDASGAAASGSSVLLAWADPSSSRAVRVRVARRTATPADAGRSR